MMQLNTVVFPAPFGPITLWMLPSATERSRRSTATSPPKRFVSRSQTRISSPVTAGTRTCDRAKRLPGTVVDGLDGPLPSRK